MEPILEAGLEATRWLQANYPQLEWLMRVMRELGTEEFYLVFIPLLYWCVHKRFATHLVNLFFLTLAINSIAKHGLRGPRPYWLDASLGLGTEDPQYGVPSNHVQTATMIYLLAASWVQKGWGWLVAIAGAILMAISRVYLGDHFVHDVVIGFLLAILLLAGYWVWERRFSDDYAKRILGQRVFFALLVPVGFAIIYLVILAIIGTAVSSRFGDDFIAVAEREGIDGVVTAISALVGIGIGFPLETSRIRFRADGPIWKRIARYLLGIVIAVLIWGGLRAIFPEDPLWLAIPLRFIRYGLLTFWLVYYAPLLFVRLGLADADPPTELRLKL